MAVAKMKKITFITIFIPGPYDDPKANRQIR